MPNLEEFIGKNFERVLRWIYPGALFVVLLYASHPGYFNGPDGLYAKIGLWGLVVGALVAGFIIYLFQAYVIGYIITVPFIFSGWDVRQRLPKKVKETNTERKPGIKTKLKCCRERTVSLFDTMARATRDRWSDEVPPKLNNYQNYAWATYHAVLMTGWLTLFFYLSRNKSADSIFRDVPCWCVILPASLFILGGFFTYLLLTRIPPKDT